MDKIIIVGAGRQGREIYSYLLDLKNIGFEIDIIGFIDDTKPKGKFGDTSILGNIDDLKYYLENNKDNTFRYITAIGDIDFRIKIVNIIEDFKFKNISPISVIHPTASIGNDVSISDGVCIAPGAIITTNVKIGSHCIVNSNVSISHDCVIGDFVNLNPSVTLCGDVVVGNRCFIGAGAIIIDKITIGDGVTVGAGSVVIRDVKNNVTVVGVPAKLIK